MGLGQAAPENLRLLERVWRGRLSGRLELRMGGRDARLAVVSGGVYPGPDGLVGLRAAAVGGRLRFLVARGEPIAQPGSRVGLASVILELALLLAEQDQRVYATEALVRLAVDIDLAYEIMRPHLADRLARKAVAAGALLRDGSVDARQLRALQLLRLLDIADPPGDPAAAPAADGAMDLAAAPAADGAMDLAAAPAAGGAAGPSGARGEVGASWRVEHAAFDDDDLGVLACEADEEDEEDEPSSSVFGLGTSLLDSAPAQAGQAGGPVAGPWPTHEEPVVEIEDEDEGEESWLDTGLDTNLDAGLDTTLDTTLDTALDAGLYHGEGVDDAVTEPDSQGLTARLYGDRTVEDLEEALFDLEDTVDEGVEDTDPAIDGRLFEVDTAESQPVAFAPGLPVTAPDSSVLLADELRGDVRAADLRATEGFIADLQAELLNRARRELRSGAYKEASATLERCDALRPDDPTVKVHQALARLLAGERFFALHEAQAAAAMAPGDPLVRDLAAAVLQRSGG